MVVRRSVAALLLTGLLVSCSEDDPSSSRHDPPATSATPTPTGSAAPTLPPEAKEDTEAGAKAFVEHWIATLNYAAATGETDALRALATPGCKPCDDIADVIDDVYGGDGSIRSDGWVLRRVEDLDRRSRSDLTLQTVVDLSPQEIRRGDGTTERTPGASAAPLVFELLLRSGAWGVRSLYQEAGR